ncbi:hypothetical protein [Aeromicrobium sp. 179-A 4D2 NHS]|uniref:hypothetical protein n=1 Tax=Aeromicrobium sp. 179-A 4D2 NHS TaxID=3142375 RepID=UPI00399F3381
MARRIIVGDLPDDTGKDDGSLWPFVMLHGERTVFADTRTELVGALIPGYDDIATGDDVTALVDRFGESVRLANTLQGFIAGVVANDPDAPFSLATATEEELTLFLSDRLDRPVENIGVTHWDHEVPLVLVTTMFEPHDPGHEIPSGNVLWIDPTDETTFLDSLADLGQIRLFTSS